MTSNHVPQYNKQGEINPYHAACPKCGAPQGEYCYADPNPAYIDGVGFVAHKERRLAAATAEECPECLATRPDEQVATEWTALADDAEAGRLTGYSPATQAAIARVARATAQTLLPTYTCSRCNHTWHPRTDNRPEVCPKCKSPYWDRPRIER